jgi:endo-1,4-beta-xylanase
MINRPISFLLPLTLFTSYAMAQGTLAEAAAKTGLNIGIATNSNQVSNGTSAYATIAKTQFNMVVCENEMKFESTESPIGSFKYNGGDGVSKFAVANSMKMRGHNFIWHSQSTSAQNSVKDRTSGLTIMRNHIEAVGGHFKTQILEWDVLNEITADGAGGLRTSFWRSAIGDDFADSALAISRRVIGSNGYLYYNDYGGDGVNSKSTSMLNLAKKWQTNKVPVDGIGLQCHLSTGFKQSDISANIKRFGDLGLRISLTEIDIKNAKAADWTALMNACLENYNCVSFVAWGMSDANSWIGSTCGCLLYNGNPPSEKTEMISALRDALSKADPAVTAKRMAFNACAPGSNGCTSAVRDGLNKIKVRHGTINLFGTSALPVFSVASGIVDVMGRNSVKSVATKRIVVLPD